MPEIEIDNLETIENVCQIFKTNIFFSKQCQNKASFGFVACSQYNIHSKFSTWKTLDGKQPGWSHYR